MRSSDDVRLGIDVGGTLTKLLVLDKGQKVYEDSAPTCTDSAEALVDFIVEQYTRLSRLYPIKRVGVGVPGTVTKGLVYADNLPIKNVPIGRMLEERLAVPVTVDNDANCAALAEALLGKTRYDNLVMITIGTGVGGGIVLDGKIRRGRGGLGEIAHMSIDCMNGLPCSCGSKGCFEQYASATALIKKAEEAAKDAPQSILHELYKSNGDHLNGILVFDALQKHCPVAERIFFDYLDILAAGIKSLIWIFDPEAVILAGGITKSGDMFIDELKKRVNSDTDVIISSLQSEAGSYGAALL